MNPNSLLWIEIFLFFSIMMVIFVPRPRIMHLLLYGLAGGMGVSVLLLYMLVPVLGLWKFTAPGLISLNGIPFFIAFAWTPVEVIYAHFLYRSSNRFIYYGSWIVITLLSSLFTQWLVYINYLEFTRWNFYSTLLISLALHGVLTYLLSRVKLLGPTVSESYDEH